jgi:ATP-dependent RNA helicase RhlE
MTTFEQFNLQNQSKAIDDLGFTPSYSGKNFSVIMSGRDMMELHKQELVKHLPIYYLIKLYKFIPGHTPKIVILVPTRELVVQVVEEVEN